MYMYYITLIYMCIYIIYSAVSTMKDSDCNKIMEVKLKIMDNVLFLFC